MIDRLERIVYVSYFQRRWRGCGVFVGEDSESAVDSLICSPTPPIWKVWRYSSERRLMVEATRNQRQITSGVMNLEDWLQSVLDAREGLDVNRPQIAA